MNNRRRLMMSPSGSFPSETIWVRLDLLKNMITTWDTTIINSDNPISRGTAFPIYAVASKQNISEGYSYATLVWFANDPTLVLTPANGNNEKCRFRLTGYGTITTFYADEMGNSLTSDLALTSLGWTSGQTVTVYTSETSTTSMGGMCTYYNAKANECYSLDAFPGNPVYFFRYQYHSNLTNYAVLLDKKDWNAYWNNHVLTLGETSASVSYNTQYVYVYVYDNGYLITGASQSDFSVTSSNGVTLSQYDQYEGIIVLSFPQNTGTSSVTRVANITYKGSTAQFTIYHNAQANLTISPTSTSITSGGQSVYVAVYNNGSSLSDTANVTVSGDGSKNSYGSGYIYVWIAANSYTYSVTKTITISYNGSSATLTVTQAAAANNLTINPTSWNAPSSGGNTSVKTYLNGNSVYASNVSVTSSDFSISTANSSYNKIVTVGTNPNQPINCSNSSWLVTTHYSGTHTHKITIPSPGNGGNNFGYISFKVCDTTAEINLTISASSEANYDYGALGKIDETWLKNVTYSEVKNDTGTHCTAKVSGTESSSVTFENMSVGWHTIPFCYVKDGSASSNNDNIVITIGELRGIHGTAEKSGRVTFSYNGASANLSVTQSGKVIDNYIDNANLPDGYYCADGLYLDNGIIPLVKIWNNGHGAYYVSRVYCGAGYYLGYDAVTGEIVTINNVVTQSDIENVLIFNYTGAAMYYSEDETTTRTSEVTSIQGFFL